MNTKPLCPVPPMGWNSWNSFHSHVSDELLCTTANAIVERGLLDAGFQYLIVDDCWSAKNRDSRGHLIPDPEKFPRGIEPVIDHVHKLGLKFGLYSCCGVKTCAGYPGSFEHEFEDASRFAAWGVDYLKHDNGYRPVSQNTQLLYRRMSMALRASGRDILLAACQWGTENVHGWIRSSGAHTFRSTVDIQDSWQSIASIARSQLEMQQYSGPDCFNDLDMLVVGMYGKGLNPETSQGGCTMTEYQTHFALWCMLNSPLIIGCDVRTANSETIGLLTNRDLIAINQDPSCRSCSVLPVYACPDAYALIRPLSGADYAIGFFNFSENTVQASVDFFDLGLSAHSGVSLRVYDCINHQPLGVKREFFSVELESHGCAVYRCTLSNESLMEGHIIQ